MDNPPDTCAVCIQEFVDPVTLSCGHLLCFPSLMETREFVTETSSLCPIGLCEYDKATPVFITGMLSSDAI